jgi:hypothetical protein
MSIAKFYYKIILNKGIKIKYIYFYTLLLFLFLLPLVGCTSAAPQKRIAQFSEATKLATGNVDSAFKTVEQSYFDTQVTGMIATYDPTKGFNIRKIEPFLNPDSIKARSLALDAVAKYASLLDDIMSDEKLTTFDLQTKALGEVLIKFNENDALQALNFSKSKLTQEDFALFTSAVNMIGRWIIDYNRQNKVQEIIPLMDPNIEKICNLLADDIGSKDSLGLRSQLSNQYETQMMYRDKFIAQSYSNNKITALELREELNSLALMTREKTTSDKTMEAAKQSLKTLRETHKKLADAFNQDAFSLEALIRKLIADAKTTKEFYDELGKMKK